MRDQGCLRAGFGAVWWLFLQISCRPRPAGDDMALDAAEERAPVIRGRNDRQVLRDRLTARIGWSPKSVRNQLEVDRSTGKGSDTACDGAGTHPVAAHSDGVGAMYVRHRRHLDRQFPNTDETAFCASSAMFPRASPRLMSLS